MAESSDKNEGTAAAGEDKDETVDASNTSQAQDDNQAPDSPATSGGEVHSYYGDQTMTTPFPMTAGIESGNFDPGEGYDGTVIDVAPPPAQPMLAEKKAPAASEASSATNCTGELKAMCESCGQVLTHAGAACTACRDCEF
ncbi:Uu.00g146820.m01.CDS01 [Anthostomella pinea]|uniref:Uu.00g146820.m01.CDS01 n=1 Tax=Anthostomella pinea TaxID=933095 RepID=A0AAI8VR96_9PEZI|nr:Uu.00g146820.m01.CDS01 [Anthostomella pinea]